MDFGWVDADAVKIFDRELSVGDDGVGGVVDEVAQFWLEAALVGEGDVLAVAVGDERNAKQPLAEQADDGGRVKVSAVDKVGAPAEDVPDGNESRADDFEQL